LGEKAINWYNIYNIYNLYNLYNYKYTNKYTNKYYDVYNIYGKREKEEEAVIFAEKFIGIFNEIAMREPWFL